MVSGCFLVLNFHYLLRVTIKKISRLFLRRKGRCVTVFFLISELEIDKLKIGST